MARLHAGVGYGRVAPGRLDRPHAEARDDRVHAEGDRRLPLAGCVPSPSRRDDARPGAEAPAAQLGPRPGDRDCARPALEHRLLAPDPARRRAQPRDLRVRARADTVARRTGHAADHVSVPRVEHARQGKGRLRQAGRKMSEQDPLIRQIREQISDNDRAIVEAINARLKLVARLKGYKESRGMSFVDPEREEWMLQYLARANRGPLSSEGLKELFEEILGLTKREVDRTG